MCGLHFGYKAVKIGVFEPDNEQIYQTLRGGRLWNKRKSWPQKAANQRKMF